jgi:hypothetical protein
MTAGHMGISSVMEMLGKNWFKENLNQNSQKTGSWDLVCFVHEGR